jgi:serine/threonine protein kinase
MSYSNYHILGLIGEGSFSQVFCAIDRRNCQLVALKELLRHRFATKQFLRELNFLLSLRHPHIVSCQSIEYHAKARYLVTDYCEGGSLRDLLREKQRLSLEKILKIAIDILSGLEYIHDRQVVHGDIKPENILLNLHSRGWVAKIADFGIAKFEREISKGMGSGGTGSPAYMAPECFYGKSTQASDLYAVGVILFELLVGNRPFLGTIKELTIAHIAQPPPIPTTLPFLLRSILNKALEKLPYNRFASATEMLAPLRLAMVTLAKEERNTEQKICHNMSIVSRCNFKVIDRELLTKAVTAIATLEEKIYLGSETEIECRTGQSSWWFSLPSSLVELKPCGDGCMVISKDKPLTIARSTERQITTYYGYYFPANVNSPDLDSRAHFSFVANRFQIATAAKVDWFITSHNLADSATIVQIWRLPDFKPIDSLYKSSFPTTSVILDRRHGSIVYPPSLNAGVSRSGDRLLQGKEGDNYSSLEPVASSLESENRESRLAWCNRRGDWFIDDFSLPVTIESLIPSLTNPNFLLAIENRQQGKGLMIKLKPFQIRRFDLDLEPDFAIATNWGFCLTSDRGDFLLLDLEGKLLARESRRDLGKILAVSAWGDDRLLISSLVNDLYYLSAIEIAQTYNSF